MKEYKLRTGRIDKRKKSKIFKFITIKEKDKFINIFL